MKTRLLFLILLFVNIVVAQQTGIGTENPTESLDIAYGGLKILDLNSSKYKGAVTDRFLKVDKDGFIKADPVADYETFHARLRADQSILTGGTVIYLIFDNPVTASALYSYDSSTGVFRFNQSGNYQITLQGGFFVGPNIQTILGVRPYPSGDYLGRASHYSSTQVGTGVSEVMVYRTVLFVPYSGYEVRFSAASGAVSTVISKESGTTGAGTVTNVTVQKI